MRNLALALAVLLCACGAQQQRKALNTIAEATLVETMDARQAFHVERDRHCREEHPPAISTFEDWRDCMEPSYQLDAAVLALDAALRLLDTLAENDDGWQEAVRASLHAAQQLIAAYRIAGLPLSDDVMNILVALESL